MAQKNSDATGGQKKPQLPQKSDHSRWKASGGFSPQDALVDMGARPVQEWHNGMKMQSGSEKTGLGVIISNEKP